MSSPISTLISADSLLGDPFYSSDFHGGFTPWENIEPLFDQLLNPDNDPDSNLNHYFAHSDSSSNKQNRNSPDSGSVLGTSNENWDQSYAGSPSSELNHNSAGSGSDAPDQDPIASIMNERKRKRRISNKESARRSRLKKQIHEKNLRDEVNKLLKEKQERTNLLRLLTHHLGLLMNENARFRTEVTALRWKLMEFNQILRLQQLQHRERLINAHVNKNNVSNNNNAIIRPQLTPLL